MIITIGRQYGAGGRELAEKLAQKLQIPLYDRKLIAIIATHLEKGVSLDEMNLSYKNLYGETSAYDVMLGDMAKVDDDNYLFKAQAKTIRLLAEKGPGIFVGRGANYILKDNKEACHFFIAADDDYRTARGAAVYHKSLKELKKEDEKRASFYNYYTGEKWGDPADYDLIINTGRTGIDKAVDIIAAYAQAK